MRLLSVRCYPYYQISNECLLNWYLQKEVKPRNVYNNIPYTSNVNAPYQCFISYFFSNTGTLSTLFVKYTSE